MASLTDYKGLQVLTTSTFIEEGGEAINDDLINLVDWRPKSNWSATVDPTSGDDSDDDYQVGSFWLNTDTKTQFICVDATVDSAVWQEIPTDISFQSGQRDSNLTIDSINLVSTGLTFSVKEDETWRFDVYLFAKELDGSADLKAQVNGPAGSTGRFSLFNVQVGQLNSAAIGSLSNKVDCITSTDSNDMIQITGVVTAGADGTVDPKIRNNGTSNTQEFYEYSYFIARRIG